MHGDTATANGNTFEALQQRASKARRADDLAPVRAT